MSENKINVNLNIPWAMIWYMGILLAIGILIADPTFNRYSSGDQAKIFLITSLGWPIIIGLFIGTIGFKIAGIK
jgi:hypothetical protein